MGAPRKGVGESDLVKHLIHLLEPLQMHPAAVWGDNPVQRLSTGHGSLNDPGAGARRLLLSKTCDLMTIFWFLSVKT